MRIVSKSPTNLLSKIREEFFDISPFDPEAAEKSRKQVLKQSFPREELSEILKEYNLSLGNSDALPFIQRLKEPDSVCVVTGQQLGFMGGPFYTILKAISCLLLARENHAIPIFWLATEDHDIHEIDQTYLVDSLGNLKEYKLHFGNIGRFVEDLELTAKHQEEIKAFLNAVNMTDFLEEIQEEKLYIRVMAKFLKRLFAGTGLVFLEPRLLRPLAKQFFMKELSGSEEIQNLLKKTCEKLEQVGLKPALAISETNLFFKDEKGLRKKVHRQDVANHFDTAPECFSTNVIARPVLQSLLIPTLSYVAGPNELYYHQQLRDYFHFHGCAMPWISLRLAATLVTDEWAMMLEKCKIEPWNPLPKRWEELFPHETDLKSLVQGLGVSYNSLHTLNNAFHPHNKEQERVLNWCQFQASTKKNLIQYFLANTSLSMNRNRLYVYL